MVQFWSTMGQSASAPKPVHRKSLKSYNSNRRSNKSQNNLSHTFTINDDNDRIELLNINQASEEELMTLPGVNREIAKCIVEHRKAIGRFRKIEDLALVRGIGADKLETIRPEICVGNKRNHHHNSCHSSRAQSYDSLKSSDSRSTTLRTNRLININKANVFDLQCVHGITQEIAANIVHYREKKGPFKQVDDLLKVKNIDRFRLNNIHRFLTVENSNDPDNNTEYETNRPSILTNGFHTTTLLPPPPHHYQQNGNLPQLITTNGISSSSLFDIFELLSTYSPRPILEETFNFQRNNEPALRIGLWNLYHLTYEKVNNPGVREVICRTILENGLSIIAVQDVHSASALRLICEELNKPRLRRVCEWKDKNHNWNFCMLDIDESQLGFIYDTDGVVDIELNSLSQGPEDTRNDCQVIIGNFKIGDLNLQLINMKLTQFAKFDLIDEKLKDLTSEEDMLLVLVDFSDIASNSSVSTEDWLGIGGLHPILPSTTNTLHPAIKKPIQSHQHISNILYNSKIHQQITGINGIVRQGLTHLAIPNGWNWGGTVSPYCPIWIELFQNINIGTAL